MEIAVSFGIDKSETREKKKKICKPNEVHESPVHQGVRTIE